MLARTTRRRALAVLCGLPVCGRAEVHSALEARISIDLADYQSTLGVVNQLAIFTRPDLLFGVAGGQDLEESLTANLRSSVFVDEKLSYILDTVCGSSSPFSWKYDSVYGVVNIFPRLEPHTANRIISIKVGEHHFKGRAWPFNLVKQYSISCKELQAYLSERRREYFLKNSRASVQAQGGASMRTNIDPPQYDLQLQEGSVMLQLNQLSAYTRSLEPMKMDHATTGFLTQYAYGWLVIIRPSSAEATGLDSFLDWSHFPR